MSAFNILICKINCPFCEQDFEGRVQFKYGNTWQFEYRLEDKIEWGGNDIGKPNQYKVMVYGILESDICPNCFSANYNEEYDIYIEEDIIRRITIMKSIENYFSEDGDFIILNK